METKKRIVNVYEILLYYIKNLKVIVLVAFLMMIAFMGLSYAEQKDVTVETTVYDIVNQNRSAKNESSTKNTYYNLPEGAGNADSKIYIDLIKDEELKTTQTSNLGPEMGYFVRSSAVLSKAIENAKKENPDIDYSDITEDNLSDMTNHLFYGEHMFAIVVTDINAKRAQSLAENMALAFVEELPNYYNVKSVKILDHAKEPVLKGVTVYGISKKQILKYGIVGAFLGAFMMLFIYFLLFVLRDVVFLEEDIQAIDEELLYSIPNKRKKEAYKYLAVELSMGSDKKYAFVTGDRYLSNYEIVNGVADEIKKLGKKVSVLNATSEDISFKFNDEINVINIENAFENLQKIVDEREKKDDIILLVAPDINKYANSLPVIRKVDRIILCVSSNKTGMGNISKTTKFIRNKENVNPEIVLSNVSFS